MTTNTISNGKALECNTYTPMGRRWTATGSGPGATLATNRYRYNWKEEQELAAGLPYTDYGARLFDPDHCTWLSPDPLSGKYPGVYPYAFCAGDPVNYVDPDGRDAILIVFPDYKIRYNGLKLPLLGHAGILLIDRKSGLTKYYEYGRYDEADKGIVRNRSIPNVIIGADGKPTQQSLKKVLHSVSKQSGDNGRIIGAYVESDDFDSMRQYAEDRMADNNNDNRREYDIINNNCGTFAAETISAAKDVKGPQKLKARPISLINSYLKMKEAKKVTFERERIKTEE